LRFAAAARDGASWATAAPLASSAAVFLPTSRQLGNRARRAMQKLADQPLTAAPIMLG
jgi:hypothetical protein